MLANYILGDLGIELEGTDINNDGNGDIFDIIILVSIILQN